MSGPSRCGSISGGSTRARAARVETVPAIRSGRSRRRATSMAVWAPLQRSSRPRNTSGARPRPRRREPVARRPARSCRTTLHVAAAGRARCRESRAHGRVVQAPRAEPPRPPHVARIDRAACRSAPWAGRGAGRRADRRGGRSCGSGRSVGRRQKRAVTPSVLRTLLHRVHSPSRPNGSSRARARRAGRRPQRHVVTALGRGPSRGRRRRARCRRSAAAAPG